jgi:transposase
MLHKARDLLVRQKTMLINALRAHLAEFGIIAVRGPAGVNTVLDILHATQGELPRAAVQALNGLADQLNTVRIEIDKIETEIKDWHRANEVSQRLATIPGIGPITASAIVASVPDATLFKSSRQFAAWLGLTPKSHSSGGKERLVGINKQGDGYIRRLLVLGATAVTRFTRQGHGIKIWASQLLDRNPTRLVTVALANKLARIVWALLIRKQSYAATVA